MASRLSSLISIFGFVFFLYVKSYENNTKFAFLTRKPGIHVGILIYRTLALAGCCLIMDIGGKLSCDASFRQEKESYTTITAIQVC